MSYKVRPIQSFEKEAKLLIKKYPSLKKELADLGKTLESIPEQGISIGKGCFKIRLAIESKGRGKGAERGL